jgi:hypothetical protein
LSLIWGVTTLVKASSTSASASGGLGRMREPGKDMADLLKNELAADQGCGSILGVINKQF